MTAEKLLTRITLAQLAASGRHVVVPCGHCPNRRMSQTTDLELPMSSAARVWLDRRAGLFGSNRDARKGRVRRP